MRITVLNAFCLLLAGGAASAAPSLLMQADQQLLTRSSHGQQHRLPAPGGPSPPAIAPPTSAPSSQLTPTNATYVNDARTPGADPFVLYDAPSGYYYAYSTEGMDEGFYFAIYRSPDLTTWEKIPGGALKACSGSDSTDLGELCWARDWQWAPEVYHNKETGWYFIFFAGRLREDLTASYFRYGAFEEPSKIGVAKSRSPAGPFVQIKQEPLQYYPFDPSYHDVNLIMDDKQMKPPSTLQEGQTAPKGIFIPTIDVNLFFARDSRIYFYYSRNAYRNWNWDAQLEKYIEESNILGVELRREWWDDPAAETMPEIVDEAKNANWASAPPIPANISSYNGTGEIAEPPRKDGWKTLISYGADPQAYENYHVDDYDKYNGTRKNRRWSEGSTLLERIADDGKPVYTILYSVNNYEAEMYGVGYATGSTPMGPFKKSAANPVLGQQPSETPPVFSTGHGSVVATVPPRSDVDYWGAQDVTYRTPAHSELFYVHHARNSTSAARSIYSTRIDLDVNKGRDAQLRMHLETQDQPIAENVAPYRLSLSSSDDDARKPPPAPPGKPIGGPSPPGCLKADKDGKVTLFGYAFSQMGARFDLSNGANRVTARFEPSSAGIITQVMGGRISAKLASNKPKQAKLVAVYQRKRLDGSWADVAQGQPMRVVTAEQPVC